MSILILYLCTSYAHFCIISHTTQRCDPYRLQRMFNCGMAMASMVSDGKVKKLKNVNQAYTVAGQIHRIIGPLFAREGKNPKCAQVYMFEPEQATSYRLQNFKDLNDSDREMAERIFTKLHNALIESKNTYIESCLGVKKWVEENCPNGVDDLRIAISADASPDPSKHKGRLNAPVAINEVSILMSEDIGKEDPRQLILNLKEPEDNGGTRTIADYHRSYDPLQYPLFYNT